jgi:hypothetical protein
VQGFPARLQEKTASSRQDPSCSPQQGGHDPGYDSTHQTWWTALRTGQCECLAHSAGPACRRVQQDRQRSVGREVLTPMQRSCLLHKHISSNTRQQSVLNTDRPHSVQQQFRFPRNRHAVDDAAGIPSRKGEMVGGCGTPSWGQIPTPSCSCSAG